MLQPHYMPGRQSICPTVSYTLQRAATRKSFPRTNGNDVPTPPDDIVSLVEQMLSVRKQLAEARNRQDENFLQTRIDATDRQIDRLVYALYNLTRKKST